jgi:hypothetical protein
MLRAYCFASCLIFHFIHCIMLTLAHIQHFYALDQVFTQSELEVQAERAQVEASTNLELDQGKPQCIKPILLVFYFESYFMFYYDCGISL